MEKATAKYERKAEHCLTLAEKALRQFLIQNAPNIKFEDATEYYRQAAVCYRVAGRWQDSGEAYGRCADLQARMGNVQEAAVSSVQAAQVYRKQDPAEAVSFYRNAISLFCELGRFSTAGNLQYEVAEMYETDGNLEEACEQYRQASAYYLGENRVEQSHQCLAKVAQHSALLGQFGQAAGTYESIGRSCLEGNMMRPNTRLHFLRSLLCFLASGAKFDEVRRKMEEFKEADFSFAVSRECLFVSTVLPAVEAKDLNVFADNVYDFDNVEPMDSVLLRILRTLHEQLIAEPETESEDEDEDEGGGDEGGGGGPSRDAAEVPVDDKGVPKNLGAYD